MEGLSLYAWTLAGGTIVGCALAVAGAHLATRGRTLQALCVSQGAELGALAAVLAVLLRGAHLDDVPAWGGLLGAVAGAFVCGAAARECGRVRASSRTVLIFALWLVLLSATHLSVALHPLLESHLSKMFLGDLTTLSDIEAQVALGTGVFALFGLSLRHRALSRHSFDAAVLMRAPSRSLLGEELAFLLLSAFSTWAMGFLFTCVCLFVPTAVMAPIARTTARGHILLCAAIPLLSIPPGILFSLSKGNVPTVPAVAIVMMIMACVAAALCNLARLKKVT